LTRLGITRALARTPFARTASRRTPFVLAIAVLLVTLLAGSAWAAFGAMSATWSSGLLALLGPVDATATPTRTPRPETTTPTPVPLALEIVVPTGTPTATATPAPAPDAVTPEALPGWLAEIVDRYGMDPGRRFIVVELASQQMIAWEPGKPLRMMPVSTGDETRGYRTLAWYGLVGDYWGTFNSFGVYADEGWYLFEDAGTILIHGAPYRLENGKKVYEDIGALGAYPASRGCIRLSPEDAAWFTAWQPQGVPIVILPKNEGAAG
jgi:lipoprotein-anchoring transpeptidase ErfK/SrfK